jgi:ribonuclease P protein component
MRRRSEFQRVFDAGRRAHGRHLTIVFAPAPGADSRLGIVASRKIGGAVARNRAKRLIREAFRTSESPRLPLDLVVIPKVSVVSLTADELAGDFRNTVRRLPLSKP